MPTLRRIFGNLRYESTAKVVKIFYTCKIFPIFFRILFVFSLFYDKLHYIMFKKLQVSIFFCTFARLFKW